MYKPLNRLLSNNRRGGFTLIEMLLSLALIALIAGVSVPIYQSLQIRTDLDIAAASVAQTLRRAQVLAQASDGDVSWGVYIQSGSSTLFRGASFAGRNPAYDEVFDISPSVLPSGLSEIVFTKFSGAPQSTGTVTLTSSVGQVRTVTINAKGTVTY